MDNELQAMDNELQAKDNEIARLKKLLESNQQHSYFSLHNQKFLEKAYI